MNLPESTDFPDGDPLLAGLQPGFLVGGGRYTLERLLGLGPGSVVWLALDSQLGEEVALKFFPTAICSDPPAMDDIRRAAQNARRLSHPNIVRIFDVVHAPGELAFISMEYVEGANLDDLRLDQAGQAFSWATLKPFIEHICAALEYAHAEGVVHGNIKPANLILDRRGRLKVADFGMPLRHRITPTPSGQENASQTLAYLSPQILDGSLPTVSDDIYAFGASVYELLNGKPPFWTGDIIHQVRNARPQALAERRLEFGLPDEVPPHITALLMACLAKNPDERPPSASAMAEWINAAPVSDNELAASAAHPAEPLSLVPPVTASKKPEAKLDPVAEAEAFERSIASGLTTGSDESDPKQGRFGKIAALIGAALLVVLGYLWGSNQTRKPGGPVSGDMLLNAQMPPKTAEGSRPPVDSSETPVVHVGRGPSFAYRYQPRLAQALDTNALNTGVRWFTHAPESANCSFIIAAGETDGSSGAVTYRIEPSPNYLIQEVDLEQSAALYSNGRILGEYSVDGGSTFQEFYATPPYNGEPVLHGETVHLGSLNASNLLVRYTIQRSEGSDFQVQFLRDADDMPRALSISGKVIPSSRPANAREVACTPDETMGLRAILAEDGPFTIVEQAGIKYWLIPGRRHLYLGVDDSVRAALGSQCEVELQYRNTGSGDIRMHYDSTDNSSPVQGAYKEHPNFVKRMNTGEWRTETFPVTDARFENRENAGADLRFYNNGDPLLIRSVRIRRLGP